MYIENDYINMTPRDRVNEELSQRGNSPTLPPRTRINCRGDKVNTPSQRLTWGLDNYPLASVYSPIQVWRNLYEPEEALKRGTLFKELDLPFVCGDRGTGGGCCGK